MIDVFDRIVQYPGRYRLKEVAGQAGVFDLELVPGVVTEPGTAVNRALFRQVQYDSAMTSFQALVTNANTDSLDAAFGKGRITGEMYGLGLALAMYAWFRGTSRENTFSKLMWCNDLEEITKDLPAYKEMLTDAYIVEMINLSPHASEALKASVTIDFVRTATKDRNLMQIITQNNWMVNTIRENEELLGIINANRTALLVPGEVSYQIPADYKNDFVLIQLVGGGGAGSREGADTAVGGKCGEYINFVLPVTPGQILNGNIGAPGGSGASAGPVSFAGRTANAGIGASQDGAFLVKAANGGQSYSGAGEGGFEGGLGGKGVNRIQYVLGGSGNLALGAQSGTGGGRATGSSSTAGENGAGGGGYCSSNGGVGGGGGGYGGGGGGAWQNGTPSVIFGGGGSGAIVIHLFE